MNKRISEMTLIMIFVVLSCILALTVTGCDSTQAEKISYNVSKEADNFNVTRRLTVVNTRTDKVLLQMTGNISIQDVEDGIAVIVELDRDKSIYQKHYVYLNEWTMYTVEDVSGVNVSRYAYEAEFMPQSIVPIRITAHELQQDIDDASVEGE